MLSVAGPENWSGRPVSLSLTSYTSPTMFSAFTTVRFDRARLLAGSTSM